MYSCYSTRGCYWTGTDPVGKEDEDKRCPVCGRRVSKIPSNMMKTRIRATVYVDVRVSEESAEMLTEDQIVRAVLKTPRTYIIEGHYGVMCKAVVTNISSKDEEIVS